MAHFGLMKELIANRVNSVDLDGDIEIRKKAGGSARERERRFRRTDEGQWNRRRSQIQSWKTTRSSTRSRSSHRGSSNKHGSAHRVDSKKANTLESPRRGRRKSDGDVLNVELPEPLRPELSHEILHHGMLYKTTRPKTTRTTRAHSEHKQLRRFQLTEHALEYTQLLQKVCSL